MAVSAADVKRLREMTGAGMLDCKNALTEADGDFDKAVEILRVKGAKGVNKRAERTASNGLVTSLPRGHRTRRPARAELRDRLRGQDPSLPADRCRRCPRSSRPKSRRM